MSIWGKILGGAVGFGFGGPIGALLGVLAGHIAVDKPAADARENARRLTGRGGRGSPIRLRRRRGHARRQTRQGRRACQPRRGGGDQARVPHPRRRHASGRRHLRRGAAGGGGIRALRATDRRDLRRTKGVARRTAGRPADGRPCGRRVSPGQNAASCNGWRTSSASTISGASRRLSPAPLPTIGATPTRCWAFRRKRATPRSGPRYRGLMRDTHPDRLAAQGLPEELVEVANKKAAEVNAAYDRVKRSRGLT